MQKFICHTLKGTLRKLLYHHLTLLIVNITAFIYFLFFLLNFCQRKNHTIIIETPIPTNVYSNRLVSKLGGV